MDRRRAAVAAAVIAVLALGVAGALALGGGGDEPRDVAPGTETERASESATGAEPDRTERAAEPVDEPDADSDSGTAEAPAKSAPEPEPDPDPATEPARYTPYSASSGDWQAELPSGNGWGEPSETQLGGGRRLRVSVRGPAGAALVIDHTPSEPARFGSKYRSRRELPQPSVGSMIEYSLSDDAVGYVLNAGEGGFRVFATGVEGPVARRVADSLTLVDL